MTPRVVLSGYYGFDNLGDDAVLAATVDALRARRPGLEIVVLSRAPRATGRALGVCAVPRGSVRAVARALACDLFLSGGGSLFQDATSWRSPWYYLGVLALARRRARRTAVYAQGIGPLRGGPVRAAARRVLEGVDLITVRDAGSLRTLGALGVRRPPALLAADPAFLLAADVTPRVRHEVAAWGRGIHAGLALRAWGDGAWQPAVAQAAGALTARHGVRWICLAMHPPGDTAVAASMAARLGAGARVVREAMSAREMLALVGRLDLLLGMRLHALVFAAVQGVPFVALSYDPKVAALAEELEAPALPAAALEAGALEREAEAALAELDVRRGRLLAAAAPLRARAALAPALAAGLLA
jgi:polysaccharide pyruvyl transferase CsaB